MLAIQKLGVTLRFDEFAGHELIHGQSGFGPRLDDAALNHLRLAIDEQFKFRVGKEFFIDVVSDRARRNRLHPVRDYLVELVWDGTPRIDEWLITYAGAPDTPYVRAVSRLVLVAAVRRVRTPGVKFDEMPILEGEQGSEKSSALRVLAVRDEWFADDLPLAADTRGQMEATAGKWIVEAGELKGMGRADVTLLKGYLSRQVDQARMAYGRKATIVPRQFVIVGTTNEINGYLRDTTGNRRFWPVRIQRFDLDRLRSDRDQLWAEAAALEGRGESIRLDPKLYSAAAVEQQAREIEDPMEAQVGLVLGPFTGKLRTVDAWRLLGIEPAKASQDQISRFGAAMRKHGWERKQRRFGGPPTYAYVRGTQAQREVELCVEIDDITRQYKITPITKRPR